MSWREETLSAGGKAPPPKGTSYRKLDSLRKGVVRRNKGSERRPQERTTSRWGKKLILAAGKRGFHYLNTSTKNTHNTWEGRGALIQREKEPTPGRKVLFRFSSLAKGWKGRGKDRREGHREGTGNHHRKKRKFSS